LRACLRAAAAAALPAALLGCATPGAAGGGGGSHGADAPGGDPGGLIGNPAPDFHVQALSGAKGSIALADLRGQVVLVDFWGTFCAPCKKSFPKLEELHVKYGKNGLRIIGISEDEDEDKGKIPSFTETTGVKFPIAWDAEKSIARQYHPETMPSSFLIDKRGVVRFSHVGYHDGEEAVVEREIKDLLSE
jgi:peroxiredoxin